MITVYLFGLPIDEKLKIEECQGTFEDHKERLMKKYEDSYCEGDKPKVRIAGKPSCGIMTVWEIYGESDYSYIICETED